MATVVYGLSVYPVKGCRGIALAEARIGPWGIAYDREWMVVDPDGQMRTQRTHPALAGIGTRLDVGALVLTADRMPEIRIPLARANGAWREVAVWNDRIATVDAGDAAAAWVSEVVRASCRLVRVDADTARSSRGGIALIAFHDAYPFLIISAASLHELNRRIIELGGVSVPMERFRPSIVVTGCDDHAEDRWARVRIGDVEFHNATPCVRCAATTVDQATGERDPMGEPLRTLATYRRQPDGGVTFGRNIAHLTTGVIRVGDAVQVLATITE